MEFIDYFNDNRHFLFNLSEEVHYVNQYSKMTPIFLHYRVHALIIIPLECKKNLSLGELITP